MPVFKAVTTKGNFLFYLVFYLGFGIGKGNFLLLLLTFSFPFS